MGLTVTVSPTFRYGSMELCDTGRGGVGHWEKTTRVRGLQGNLHPIIDTTSKNEPSEDG